MKNEKEYIDDALNLSKYWSSFQEKIQQVRCFEMMTKNTFFHIYLILFYSFPYQSLLTCLHVRCIIVHKC